MSRTATTRSIALAAIAWLAACGGAETPPAKPAPKTVSIAELEAGGVRSLDALTAIARRSDHPQRAEAIRALGRLGDDAAVRALGDLAGDPDAATRARVAVSLGIAAQVGAGGEAIAAVLVKRWEVEQDLEARSALATALGRSGQAAAVAPLVAGLADERPELAGASALALGLLGRAKVAIDEEARGALVELASSGPNRYAATYALAREHQPPVDPVVIRVLEALAGDGDPEVRALALTGLARRKRGRARFVAGLDDRDWRVAVAAIGGLAELGSDAATGDLARWVGALDPTSFQPVVVRAALRVLIERADVPAAGAAARTLSNKVVQAGVTSLDRAQVHCLAEAVKTRAFGGTSGLETCGKPAPAWWRKSLLAEVIATRKARSLERLSGLAGLASDDDPRVRAAALTGLTKLGADVAVRSQVIDAITRGIADRSPAVAGTAVDAVAGLSLTESESGPVFAALVERGAGELDGDGELGLTIINAVAANRIAAGEPMCRAAHVHRNRALRRAGQTCLEVLGKGDVGPGEPAPAPTLEHRPEASGPLVWTVETSRGALTIELDPALAPWHVAAIAGLTRGGFYDGLLFHRVVPGFVTQGGDPTGTGWGGPGFVLPPEPSDAPYDRGVVGIADAGPGTGGSQWFITHARTPHLEGRYTIIGRVTRGLEVVDAITVGDTIVKATIASK